MYNVRYLIKKHEKVSWDAIRPRVLHLWLVMMWYEESGILNVIYVEGLLYLIRRQVNSTRTLPNY